MRVIWNTYEAEQALKDIARRQAAAVASRTIGPCPNCGAPAEVDMLDVSTMNETAFVSGVAHCSARCFETDPEGYLEAVRRPGGLVPEWVMDAHQAFAEQRRLSERLMYFYGLAVHLGATAEQMQQPTNPQPLPDPHNMKENT